MADQAMIAAEHFMVRQDGTVQDPYPMWATLRSEAPLMQTSDGVWLVLSHDAVSTLLRDPRFSRLEAAKRDMGVPKSGDPDFIKAIEVSSDMLINQDEPDHSRLRRLVRHIFLPGYVEGLRGRIEAAAAEIVGRAARVEGPFDFLEEVSYPLPEVIICDLLGVPHGDRDIWGQLSRVIASFNRVGATQSAQHEVQEATAEFYRYMRDLVADRRRDPRDDMLSYLIKAQEEEDKLSADELIATMIMFVQAGHETTANTIGNALYHLLREPALFDQLKADPEQANRVFEETMRMNASSHMCLPRLATEDVAYKDFLIPAGSKVVFVTAAANRDPAIFARPEQFDFERADLAKHVGFGGGIHVCAGQHLARLEGAILIREVARQLPDLELVEEPRWKSGKPRLLEALIVQRGSRAKAV